MTLAFASSVGPVCRTPAPPAIDAARPRKARAAVLRRKRATAVDESGAGAAGSRDIGDEKVAGSQDSEASDLALPDLRALFAGAGDPNCVQCAGRGETVCAVCNAKGFITVTMMDTVSSSQCRLCRGKKSIPCPTCRKDVYKSVLWWDLIPTKDEDPDENWRTGPDGEPRVRWGENPAE